MISANSLYKGRVIRRRDLDHDAASETSHRTAHPEIESAQKQAAAILAAARAEAEHIVAAARDDAERELAERLVALDRDYRRDLADLQPRLADLVRQAVQSILDDMPAADVAARVVKRALQDMPDRDVALRCAPSDVEQAEYVAAGLGRDGASAVTVTTDPHLASGAWRLEAGGVAVEIGPRAQVDMLAQVLAASLHDDPRAGPQ